MGRKGEEGGGEGNEVSVGCNAALHLHNVEQASLTCTGPS